MEILKRSGFSYVFYFLPILAETKTNQNILMAGNVANKLVIKMILSGEKHDTSQQADISFSGFKRLRYKKKK